MRLDPESAIPPREPESLPTSRLRLIEPLTHVEMPSFEDEVRAGLKDRPRSLPCRFFYDEVGSKIFEEICDLDEYYLTRVERSILVSRAMDIARAVPFGSSLVELGSGSAEKTRLLIDALLARQGALRFVPIDISRSALVESSQALLLDHPTLDIVAICAEYDSGLAALDGAAHTPRLILWLGSSVGNLHKPQAADFLSRVRDKMGAKDRLLIGIDLRKERTVLERAYDDAQGVTARFNKNLLTRVNRELGGNFDLSGFRFRAHYDEVSGAVESSLVSLRDQEVDVAALSLQAAFSEGETIHTENSYKYSLDEIDTLAERSGMQSETRWLDDGERYSLNLFCPC
ncbi:MAG: L-histidine N(alpha)-methyltransferase [Myxococcota bacterium]|nr:L-histidine N(alpha)-methyltransferase [Myxococcota bacterium]